MPDPAPSPPPTALSPQAARMLQYLHARAAALAPAEIRARVRVAAAELDAALADLTEADARRSPGPDEWSLAHLVDHVAQTTIRGAEELRHLLAGRRPPGPPVYDALTSGGATWAPWDDLLAGLQEANAEYDAVLAGAGDGEGDGPEAPTVRAVLMVNRREASGAEAPELFVAELGWKPYALVQRLHLLDHRSQARRLRALSVGRSSASGGRRR